MVFSFENKKLVKISNELVPSANWTILGDGVDSNTILSYKHRYKFKKK